ncbi:VanW family protein [Patescibacteria group bacterium]|nr:VanW family protein [Patescibacteria group bacterium]
MKWLLIMVTIFLFFLTILGLFVAAYNNFFEDRFFPGVKVINYSLKNLNTHQSINKFQQAVDDFLQKGITYKFHDEEINIPLILPAAADPDLSIRLIDFKVAEAVVHAYNLGRGQGYYENFLEQMKALIFGISLPLKYEFYQEEFLEILQDKLAEYIAPKAEASLRFDEDFNLEILPENSGTSFNYQLILTKTLEQISQLIKQPLVIDLILDEPAIKQADITESLSTEIQDFVTNPAITFVYQDKNWQVGRQVFKDWLMLKKENGQVILGLEPSTTAKYLTQEIALAINQPVADAKFEIKNGRVTEFQGSHDGLELDIEKSIIKTEEELFKNDNLEIELVVNEIKAAVATGSINDVGIAEILGTGYSDFGGSPSNRKHNITIGADSLNGILIKPNEEFSLIKALGAINAATGYKPELVIKGDRTVPEYGGGLCQIGTTIFRTALAAGLPITERRPHSYRVSYYEPAGKDATIYDPRPDLKFVNDTPYHILIQSRIEGNDLYFDFWGTKDGRLIEQSDSVIYNITGSGPTQYIETTELEPGEKNCIESAHAGADAYFDYKVTYPGGEIKEERFTSHYVPWPARCLVGKEPETATSTGEVIEE